MDLIWVSCTYRAFCGVINYVSRPDQYWCLIVMKLLVLWWAVVSTWTFIHACDAHAGPGTWPCGTSFIVIFTTEVPVQFAVTWVWHQCWCWSMAVVGSGCSVWVLDRELVWNVWWKPLADTFWRHWEDRPTWINLIWSDLVELRLFAFVGPDVFRLPFACLRATGMLRERIYSHVVGFS